MSNIFLGQVLQGGWNFAPRGFVKCSGQLMSIAQNTALFSLLGTTYGGDGATTFGIPDMQGRRMIHQGQGPGLSNYVIGQKAGTETTTLNTGNLPVHTHNATFTNTSKINATTNNASLAGPANNAILAKGVDVDVSPDAVPQIYAPAGSTPAVQLAQFNVAGPVTVSPSGGSQAFGNLPPYTVMTFVIATEGIFPSQN